MYWIMTALSVFGILSVPFKIILSWYLHIDIFMKSWDEYKEYMHWYHNDDDSGFGSVFAYLAVFNLI